MAEDSDRKVIGRLPPDQLDATEWRDEYRLPKNYDPKRHDLWWVEGNGVHPGWYIKARGIWFECGGFTLVRPAKAAQSSVREMSAVMADARKTVKMYEDLKAKAASEKGQLEEKLAREIEAHKRTKERSRVTSSNLKVAPTYMATVLRDGFGRSGFKARIRKGSGSDNYPVDKVVVVSNFDKMAPAARVQPGSIVALRKTKRGGWKVVGVTAIESSKTATTTAPALREAVIGVCTSHSGSHADLKTSSGSIRVTRWGGPLIYGDAISTGDVAMAYRVKGDDTWYAGRTIRESQLPIRVPPTADPKPKAEYALGVVTGVNRSLANVNTGKRRINVANFGKFSIRKGDAVRVKHDGAGNWKVVAHISAKRLAKANPETIDLRNYIQTLEGDLEELRAEERAMPDTPEMDFEFDDFCETVSPPTTDRPKRDRKGFMKRFGIVLFLSGLTAGYLPLGDIAEGTRDYFAGSPTIVTGEFQERPFCEESGVVYAAGQNVLIDGLTGSTDIENVVVAPLYRERGFPLTDVQVGWVIRNADGSNRILYSEDGTDLTVGASPK